MIIRKHNGQTLIEYTMLLIIVLAVFLTVGNYVKRGIQGRWKQSVDDLGDQYDPRHSNSLLNHIVMTNSYTEIFAEEKKEGSELVGYYTSRKDHTNSYDSKKGSVTVGAY